MHQLLSILPMDLRLSMLTENSAQWLYKVLRESQLPYWLGDDWYTLGPHDHTLPTWNNNRACTTLCTLAARVPAKGPCIDSFPNLPPDAPNWEGRVKRIPKQSNWDYPQVVNAMVKLCQEGQIVNIFCMGTLSNQNCQDGKQVGVASAILYHNGQEWGHVDRSFGETVTYHDIAFHSIIPALELITNFLNSPQSNPKGDYIISLPLEFTISKVLDTSLHKDQAVILQYLDKIGELLESYPEVNLRLLWLPRSSPFVGFRRAKQCVLKAIHTAILRNEEETHSIRDQERRAKEDTTIQWAVC